MMQGMASIRLKFVTIDRSEGVTRYYFRVPGTRKIRLPGTPGSLEFMAAYQDAMKQAGKRPATAMPPAGSGTLGSAINAYFRSAAFAMLSPLRKKRVRSILETVQTESGSTAMRQITRGVLIKSRDRRADKPGAANEFVKAIRAVFKHALDIEMISANPARELSLIRYKTSGFHTWTQEEITTFVKTHKPGSKAHLALCIFAFTGCRPGDAPRLGRQHVRDGRIVFTPSKTAKSSGIEVNVKIMPPLQRAIDGVGGRMTFLETDHGVPHASGKAFQKKFKKWCVEAGLPHCTAHGVRKGVASISAEEGSSDAALMSLFGWTDREQAGVYTRAASRARMADAAVEGISRAIAKDIG